MISDFGFGLYLIRECNIPNTNYKSLLAQVFIAKAGLFFIAFSFFIIFFLLRSQYYLPIWVVIAFLFNAFFITSTNTFISFFQATNKFYIETICLAIFTGVLVIGLVHLYFCPRLRVLLVYYSLAAIGMFMTSLFYLNNILPLKDIRTEFNLDDFFQTVITKINEVKFFALILIGDTLFISLDILILEYYMPIHDLGIYMLCLKLLLAACLLSSIINSVLQPELRESILNKLLQVKEIIKLILIMGSAGFFIAIFYYMICGILTTFLFGENYFGFSKYRIIDFRIEVSILIWLKYMLVIPSIVLVMSNQYMQRMKGIWLSILISFILYMCFIPVYGICASFVISIITHSLLLLFYLKSLFSGFRFTID